jgi:hypothetical protein
MTKEIKILKVLAILLLLVFVTLPAMALPDPTQTPTLAWQQTVVSNMYPSGAPALSDTAGYYPMIDASLGYPNYQWRIEKRDLTTGALIPEFGAGGVITENPSNGNDIPSAVAVSPTGLYIVGSDSLPGNSEWRIEKRDLTTGALIPEFGTGGVITENPSVNGFEGAGKIVLDDTGIYVGGADCLGGSDLEWRIEKRDLTTGALIPEFGTGGVITENPSNSSYEGIYNAVVDSTGFYIIGRDASLGDGNRRDVIQKRDLLTGELIQSFGLDGTLGLDYPETGMSFVARLALDASGLYFDRSGYATGLYKYAFQSLVLCLVFLCQLTSPTAKQSPLTPTLSMSNLVTILK